MYCLPNFKTKKQLIEAVAAGKSVAVFSPGIFRAKVNGIESIEGPHSPKPHTWYCDVEVLNGRVMKVLGQRASREI